MTFCEMHKLDGGCVECPNRWVCKNSTELVADPQDSDQEGKTMKEKRMLCMYDLRNLCIEKNWYTHGDTEEYSKLLNMAEAENVTTEIIVEMAENIKSHSDVGEYDLASICFEIAEICHTVFEEA